MDYFHEGQRRDEQARQREEVRRLELERDQKADEIRRLEQRVASRDQSMREKDELIGELTRRVTELELEREYLASQFEGIGEGQAS